MAAMKKKGKRRHSTPVFTKRYHPPGTPPGTLTLHEPSASPLRLYLVDYDADHFSERMTERIEDCLPSLAHPDITWIHAQGPVSPQVLQRLGGAFNLHPLALEDILNSGQRPKLETTPDQIFAVINLPLHRDNRLWIDQLSLFMGKDYVISFHQGEIDPFESVRTRLRTASGGLRHGGADALFYALIDLAVDQGYPVLDILGEELEQLEDELLNDPQQQTMVQLHQIRRELAHLRRHLWPQREVLNSLLRDIHPLIHPQTRPYLRDCYDHVVQVMDIIESYRDMIANMLDIYHSSISNRLNEVMRLLTVISTLFIPPTFVVGLYGMNFDRQASPWNMPELSWTYGYPAVVLLIVSMMGGMLVYFRKKKWF